MQQLCLHTYAACSSNSYRSLDNSTCVLCPDFSTSEAASSYCQCIEGNYRAPSDTIHSSCTSMLLNSKFTCMHGIIHVAMSLLTSYSVGPPSAPTSLTVVASANVSCTLGWTEPADNGGRSDTFYSIRYREGGSSSNPITTSNVNYVITNLKPVTVYEISVTAENGVSHNEVSLDDLHQRTATTTYAQLQREVCI